MNKQTTEENNYVFTANDTRSFYYGEHLPLNIYYSIQNSTLRPVNTSIIIGVSIKFCNFNVKIRQLANWQVR